MELESFINMFALDYVSRSFAESIDRLEPADKWFLTMKVAFQKELNKG